MSTALSLGSTIGWNFGLMAVVGLTRSGGLCCCACNVVVCVVGDGVAGVAVAKVVTGMLVCCCACDTAGGVIVDVAKVIGGSSNCGIFMPCFCAICCNKTFMSCNSLYSLASKSLNASFNSAKNNYYYNLQVKNCNS